MVLPVIAALAAPFLQGIFASGQQHKKETFERQRIQMLAKDARLAGIHPLAAMGAASGYQNPFGGASPSGTAIGDGMAALGQLRQRKDQTKNRSLETKLLNSQIAETQSRTILNQANAKRSLVGPGSPVDPYAPRQENALVKVKLEDGTIVWMPNPDVYEIGPTELATGRILLEGGRAVEAIDSSPKQREPKPKRGAITVDKRGKKWRFNGTRWNPYRR